MPFIIPAKTCPICGILFHNSHQKVKMCSSRCANIARTRCIRVPCSACGKEFERPPSRLETFMYCSRECRKRPFIELKCLLCGEIFIGTGAQYWHPIKLCSKKCKRRHSSNLAKTYPRKPRRTPQPRKKANHKKGPESPKWKERIKITCAYCGVVFETYPCRVKAKYCSNAHHIIATNERLRKGKRTNIEIAMAQALNEIGVRYTEQTPMFGKFLVDFLLTDYPVIIQCDGVYWHSTPRVKGRDKGQDAYFAKVGYTVLRFDDQQILKQLDTCLTAIQNTINTTPRIKNKQLMLF